MFLRSLLPSFGLRDIIPKTAPPGLLYLFKLAWQSKIRLPVLLAVVVMLTDYHLQLEIDIDIRFRAQPNEDGPQSPPEHWVQQLDLIDNDDENWETESEYDSDELEELQNELDVLLREFAA